MIGKSLACLIMALALVQPAQADRLQELAELAMQNDATLAVAKARNDAAQDVRPLARSQLLPQLSINGSVGRQEVTNSGTSFFGAKYERDYDFKRTQYGLSLVQPLFRLDAIQNYRQAESQINEANSVLARSKLDLLQKVTLQYLTVLNLDERLALFEQQKLSYTEQKQQAKKLYDAGFGTVTDIAETQSRLDILVAQEDRARTERFNRLQQLRNTIGVNDWKPEAKRPHAIYDSHPHRQLSLDEWLRAGKMNSPIIGERASRVRTAELELSKIQSEYLPSVDLRLQWEVDKNPGYSSIGSQLETRQAMIVLGLPILEGGKTVAQARQASALLQAAKQEERESTEQLALAIGESYSNLDSILTRISALAQAVASNELTVKATTKGVQAGIRTNVDVLNAKNQLFDVRVQYATAQYEYLQEYVKLRALAGVLDTENLQDVDRLLVPLAI